MGLPPPTTTGPENPVPHTNAHTVPESSQTDAPLRTPRIEGLLSRLGRRLSLQVWLHGLGTVAMVVVAGLLLAFLADWALHVPRAVRWVLLAAVLLAPAVMIWRELLGPLRRRPDGPGLAVLIERNQPKLNELLVSAVQLQGRPNGSPELIGRVIEDAERAASEVSLGDVLDARRPRRRMALGSLALALLVVLALSQPTYASIFVRRLIGADVAWPQRTYLAVSVPLHSDRAWIEFEGPEEDPDRILVRVARGADVPILVDCEGVVPDAVRLHFGDDQELSVPGNGQPSFRTVLRSLQEETRLYVTGGDDRRGRPEILISVLEPPDISGIAIRVTPPAYTGRPEAIHRDRDVEVVAGTRVEVVMLPDPPDAQGIVQLLPEGTDLELSTRAFPRESSLADDPNRSAAALPTEGLGFEFVAEESMRFRFRLTDSSGLQNPDPGLYAVEVMEDRHPDVSLLSPGRTELNTTAQGTLSLRARASDDFGLVDMSWVSEIPGLEGEATVTGALDWGQLPPASVTEESEGGTIWGSDRPTYSGGSRIEIRDLAGPDGLVAPGSQFHLEVIAKDNRPEPGVGRSVPLRVRVVTDEELLRRLQDRLAQVRTQAARLEALVREKATRTDELIAALESEDEGDVGVGARELATLLTGMRRIEGDSEAISRELASIVETVLYARLDEKAGSLLENVDQGMAQVRDRRFHADVWRAMTQAYKAGQLGSPGFAGQLVDILAVSLEVSEVDSIAGTAAIDDAAHASDVMDVHEHLTGAATAQAQAQAHVEELLARLAEWDNFQSVLTLTRDILNRQKSVQDRTRRFGKER